MAFVYYLKFGQCFGPNVPQHSPRSPDRPGSQVYGYHLVPAALPPVVVSAGDVRSHAESLGVSSQHLCQEESLPLQVRLLPVTLPVNFVPLIFNISYSIDIISSSITSCLLWSHLCSPFSRMFLHSGWGWTCIFVGSFVFLLSFSIRRSLSLSIRHLSRLAVAGGLWLSFCKLLDLLENATGSCYEPLEAGTVVTNGQTLLVLREGESKSECLKAGMLWRGYEVSEDIFLLCLCCLLLVEETAVFGPYLSLGGISDAPLRILFLFCVLLLWLWIFLLLCLLAYFPQFPTQMLGGALGCLSWRGLYQGWYRLGPSWYCPGRPGLGLLNIKAIGNDVEDAQLKQPNHDHCN